MTKILVKSIGFLSLLIPHPASGQIVPQPWVSVGGKDGAVTYSVGAKALGFGVEVGTGPHSSTGVDILKFLNLPVISPYVGIGYYSENQGVAISGGVHLSVDKHIFIGSGYNSVRGFNGQIGVNF